MREIATDEVYAVYTRTTYARGELIPAAALPDPRAEYDRVIVAIDAAAGTVEIVTREYLADATRRLIRDASGRLFTWEADARPVARDGSGVLFDHFDPTSPGDGWLGRYVVLSPSLQEVAAFELPSKDWEIEIFDFDGGYLLARSDAALAVVDLARRTTVELDPRADTAHTFPRLARAYSPDRLHRGEVLRTDDGFALLVPGAVGYRSRLLRYRWPDELLSDVSFDYVTGFEFQYPDSGTSPRLATSSPPMAATSRSPRWSGVGSLGTWKPPSRPFRCSMLLLARS